MFGIRKSIKSIFVLFLEFSTIDKKLKELKADYFTFEAVMLLVYCFKRDEKQNIKDSFPY